MKGVGRVVAFNWPRYVIGLAVVLAGFVVPLPAPLSLPMRSAAALVALLIVVSLVATWWVYDRSPLYTWRWLTDLLPADPTRYAVISSGLDEISPTLRKRFPAGQAALLDLYDPRLTREGSIRRARAMVAASAAARPSRPDALPVPTDSLDAVFVVFAAHELRHPAQRLELFTEIARTLRPGGSLLLVEHCRDAANIAAYGPGAWHFYPRREWLRLGREAALTFVDEATTTPLVRALIFRR
jgi:SAM-dependent methyltransferase